MQNRVTGTTMPVLEFALDHNDAVISEAGELSWMSASIQMTTHTQHAGGGGFFGVIKRVAGGGSLFMTEYRAYGAPGEVAFAARVPGQLQEYMPKARAEQAEGGVVGGIVGNILKGM